MSTVPNLSDYNFSGSIGFLLENPLVPLGEYFREWKEVAESLVELLDTKTLRERVNRMAVLDHTRLIGYRQHRLAFTYLSFISNGYVWQNGDAEVARVLPIQLSLPWCGLADYLGLQPCMGHAAFCLGNWTRIDSNGPMEAPNLDVLVRYPGGQSFRYFTTVTTQVEVEAVPGIQALVDAMRGVEENDVQRVLTSLHRVPASLTAMKKALHWFHTKLDKEVFFQEIRPYLSGWGTEGSVLPDGLIYEGISSKPRKVIGGSAAQSSTLRFFDTALGIKHNKDKQHFLDTMLEYMPRHHRQLIEDTRRAPSVSHFVARNANRNDLVEAYKSCVDAVTNFRTYHIQIVTKYIVIPSKSTNRRKDYEGVSSKGTGGTALLPFLQDLRNTTKKTKELSG